MRSQLSNLIQGWSLKREVFNLPNSGECHQTWFLQFTSFLQQKLLPGHIPGMGRIRFLFLFRYTLVRESHKLSILLCPQPVERTKISGFGRKSWDRYTGEGIIQSNQEPPKGTAQESILSYAPPLPHVIPPTCLLTGQGQSSRACHEQKFYAVIWKLGSETLNTSLGLTHTACTCALQDVPLWSCQIMSFGKTH